MVSTETQLPTAGVVTKVVGIGDVGGRLLGAMIEGGARGIGLVLADGERDAANMARELVGSDLVLIVAGMGEDAGATLAPAFAEAARNVGALSIGVVAAPLAAEAQAEREKARAGIAGLAAATDALITIPSYRFAHKGLPVVEEAWANVVRSISDLVTAAGPVTVDLTAFRALVAESGRALVGIGNARGTHRALRAARRALESPLLDGASLHRARGVIVSISGGPDLELEEIDEACEVIEAGLHAETNMLLASVIDPAAGEDVRVTVIATGVRLRLT